MNIIVTGGYGFIGNALIKQLLKDPKINLLNIDCKTSVSMPESLKEIEGVNKRYNYEFININNFAKLDTKINQFKPTYIYHLAAETHVDNSINDPSGFIKTNIVGTFNMLESIRKYLSKNKKIINKFRFIHVSTDEVYGSLQNSKPPFSEKNKYYPNSPYSASKASSDHLVRAWYKTFGIPSIITNCCNNYGPWQYPEKLIPVVIAKALKNEKIPIYGNGKNIREWIHVSDHVDALINICVKGTVGESYNIGSKNEINNLNLVKIICKYLDKYVPKKTKYSKLIHFVKDRPGHDYRYAINSDKILSSIRFKSKISIESGLNETVKWYVNNSKWLLKKFNVFE